MIIKMKRILATVAIMAMVIIPSSAARWECVRWTWSGDVYNRKVVCLEWRDKDAVIIEKKK
jgi:hypothetical protein